MLGGGKFFSLSLRSCYYVDTLGAVSMQLLLRGENARGAAGTNSVCPCRLFLGDDDSDVFLQEGVGVNTLLSGVCSGETGLVRGRDERSVYALTLYFCMAC